MAMKGADALINAGFVGLVALFLGGGPIHEGDQAQSGLRLLFSQWYPYLALFLALLAARRLLDRGTFARIGAIRLLGAIARRSSARGFVYALTAAWAVLLFVVSARRHWAFESRGDLALYEQSLWLAAHGEVPRWSLYNSLDMFAFHFDPLHLAVTPLYLVAPSPLVLLAVQAGMIALGAVPLYWIVRERLPSHPVLWGVFPAAYLAYAPLRAANRFDYHPGALVPALFLFALYMMEHRRWTSMILLLTLAGLLKENMPAAGVSVGVFLVFTRRQVWLGIALCVAFALWFYAGIAWIIPAFNPSGYQFFTNYAGLGNSLPSLVTGLLASPGRILEYLLVRPGWKLGYLLGVFGALAFLPLLSPSTLWLGAPFLAQHLLATTRAQISLQTHNTAEVVAFVFFASIVGASRVLCGRLPFARWLSRWNQDQLARTLAAVLWTATLLFHGWSEVSHLWRYQSTFRSEALTTAVHLIPPGASVAAPDRVVPHLAQRSRLYWFPTDAPPQADFVVADPERATTNELALLDRAVAMFPAQGYEPVFEQGPIRVWKRGPPPGAR
jgi:uncharacterized membrane protein